MVFMQKQILKLGFSLIMAFWLAIGAFIPSAAALTGEQRLVSEVWRIVNRAYLDETFNHQNWSQARKKALEKPLKNREAAYAAIEKMLNTLGDPFTRFLDPQQYRSLQVNTSGELTGVGLQIALNPETGKLEVVSPIIDSPADMAGIKPRDRILKIEGLSTKNLTLDQAAAKMRGPIGSSVTLLIERDGVGKKEVTIVRDRITLNPVVADLRFSPQGMPIGYLRLTQFNANADTELAHAISSLEKKGAAAYILDLRNNPGGLLQSGIEIARLWLNSGTIVYTVNRQGIQGSFESSGPALTDDPLVILVNQGTASASEILAGALQDNHRATLVGETTFGKGLIQSLFELSDGSGLAVTIAKYETPSHRDINKLGIKPDVVISQESITRTQIATEADLQYQAAVELIKTNSVLAEVGSK
ncbi:S41 family peptidase [Chrysosporum bergii ANA360D]|uniref:Carboxyl-terminal-processing protease n=1 Tax=Chrysosporum bergii ANA360D TaxID=617107 RepID=A0AA43GTC8_9CYAN|nr:carboxyl-terminal processing protease CtpA [Chrysosporum bergii]MDH6061025.1 S41 family peptidase [Chrysosporum bergii ANA360D]